MDGAAAKLPRALALCREINRPVDTGPAQAIGRADGEGGRDTVPGRVVIELARVDIGHDHSLAWRQRRLIDIQIAPVEILEGI
jgi:hypothetical protein